MDAKTERPASTDIAARAISSEPSTDGSDSSIAPGLLLTTSIAAAASILSGLPGLSVLSSMLFAVIIGMGINARCGLATKSRPGIDFVLRRLLRTAIILLGLRLTVDQVISAGPTALSIIMLTSIASFIFTVWLGRVLRVDRGLSELIAAGTAICGASAIIATNTLTRARGEDVAYALASVTLFGSIAMFVYPPIAWAIGMGSPAYGLWAGASIHEVAQVVATAFQGGSEAGEFGTVAKLARVLLLAPLLVTIGIAASRKGGNEDRLGRSAPPMPWFVFAFLALVFANSIFDIPQWLSAGASTISGFMLTMALAAMGLQTNIGRLRDRGVRPLVLGLSASIFIAIFSLTLILSLGVSLHP